jgi:hypothetical protein
MTEVTKERVKELKRFLCDRKNEFVSELKRFEYLGNVEFKEAMSRRIAFYSDLLAVIDSYSKAKGDMAKELRELVRTGRLLVTGDPADVSALINAIDDYAKVKAENEELLTTLSHHQHDLFYEKQAREKAEAENERLQRQVEIEQRKVADLDGLLAKYQGAAKEAEAQLARQAPLIEAAGKLNGGDLAWFDWMMETTIAEYAPRVDGMTCPGRGRKDRFRALFSALPEE